MVNLFIYKDSLGNKTKAMAWHLNGELHRLHKQAYFYYGHKWWYFKGKLVPSSSQEEFERLIKLRVLW